MAHGAPAAMGYWEDAGSTRSMRVEARVLGVVAADTYAVDAAGRVSGHIPGHVLALAAQNDIAMLAVVSNYANGFNAGIATAILTPGAAQDRAVAGVLRVSAGTAGVDLDFENVPHKERALYTAFATRLAGALHAAGRVLMLSVPAKTVDNPNDSWTGAYDYPALAQVVDTLQVMTYDENGPWGKPGPVSGLDWMTACLAYTLGVVPAGETSLGFPAYGYDWNLAAGGGRTVAWNEVADLMAKTGAAPQWDKRFSSPWFSYRAGDGSSHVVWYENARSIRLKAELAARQAVASVSVWALGLDNVAYWRSVFAGFGYEAVANR